MPLSRTAGDLKVRSDVVPLRDEFKHPRRETAQRAIGAGWALIALLQAGTELAGSHAADRVQSD
jgi:hypothetical protein